MRNFFKPLLNILGKNGKKSRPARPSRSLALEGLETRLAPAIDMLITSSGDPTSYTLQVAGGTATFTALTSGCKINVADIQAQLAAGNDVAISNSTVTVAPIPEVGTINWDTTLDLSSIPPSGVGRTITVLQAAGTGAGSIILGTSTNDFLLGSFNNNVNVVVTPAGIAPSSGPKVQFFGSDSVVNHLTVNADTVGYVEFAEDFKTISDMNIKAQSVVAAGVLSAGVTGSSSGDFIFTSASSSGGGIITFSGIVPAAISAYRDIVVDGSLGTSIVGTKLTLTGDTIAIKGRLGIATSPFGEVILSALNSVTVGDTGAVGKISADPLRIAYNLDLKGGVLFTDSLPTKFNSLGTIRLGNAGNLDQFVFSGGLDLSDTQNRTTITNSSLTTPSKTIILGNANLNTDVRLITGPASSPLGTAINLDTNANIAAGTNLTFNSGTSGVTSISNALTGVGSVTIDNSLRTVFQNPVTLANTLSINQTQTDVIFSKISTLNAINMLPGQGFRLNLAAPVTINGPIIRGTEDIIMTGAGSPAPISTVGGTGTNFFGKFVSSAGILLVNGTYANATASLTGGTLGGTGAVKLLQSIGASPIRTLAPGGFTPTSTTVGGATVIVNVPNVGTLTSNTISLSAATSLSIDMASVSSNDLLVSSSTVVAPVLGGASLTGTLSNGYVPAQGTVFTIVQNNTTQPVTGIFAGLPEGGTTTIGGVVFRISYLGGTDRNDVTLTTMTGVVPPGPVVTPGNGAYVAYLYQTILGRAPDSSGYSNFVNALNAGGSRATVASQIYYSGEHRSNQVQGFYQTYLERTASAAEVNGWVKWYQAGATDFQIQDAFLSSNEYLALHPPIASLISGLYVSILNRAVDAAGMATWTAQFMASVPRQQIVMAMLTSAESTQGIATTDYLQYLGRGPDAAGLAFWAATIASQGPAAGVIGLASSAEAFNYAQGLFIPIVI